MPFNFATGQMEGEATAAPTPKVVAVPSPASTGKFDFATGSFGGASATPIVPKVAAPKVTAFQAGADLFPTAGKQNLGDFTAPTEEPAFSHAGGASAARFVQGLAHSTGSIIDILGDPINKKFRQGAEYVASKSGGRIDAPAPDVPTDHAIGLANQVAEKVKAAADYTDKDNTYFNDVVEGIGGIIPWVVGGATAKAAGVSPIILNLGMSGLQSALASKDTYHELVEKGDPNAKAKAAAVFGADFGLNYVSHKLGFFATPSPQKTGLMSALGRWLGTTLIETGNMGVGQTMVGNIAAGRAPMENVGTAAATFAPAAALFGLGGEFANQRTMGRANENMKGFLNEVATNKGTKEDAVKIIGALTNRPEAEVSKHVDNVLKNNPDIAEKYTKQSIETAKEKVLTPVKTPEQLSVERIAEQFPKEETVAVKKEEPKEKVQTTPIDKLVSHEGAPDKVTVEEYKARIEAGETLEPIKIIKEGTDTFGIEDGKHRYEAYKELGIKDIPTVEVPAPIQTVKVPGDQLPVGKSETKVSKLEARIKGVYDKVTPEQAKEAGLTTYEKMNKKENIAEAAEFVSKDPQAALRVLKGEEAAPKGLTHGAIAIAAEAHAELAGDADLIAKLASLRATRYGQEISILTEADPLSITNQTRQIQIARETAAKKTLPKSKSVAKARGEIVAKGKAEVKTTRMKLAEAQALLDKLVC